MMNNNNNNDNGGNGNNDGGVNVLKPRTKFTKKNVKHNGSILIPDNEKRNDSALKLGAGGASSASNQINSSHTENREKKMNIEIGLLGNIKKKIVAKPSDKGNEKTTKSKMDESGQTQQSVTKPSSTSATKT